MGGLRVRRLGGYFSAFAGGVARQKQTRRTTVKDVRAILRLTCAQGPSVREVADRLNVSKSGFETILGMLQAAGVENLRRVDHPYIDALEQLVEGAGETCEAITGWEKTGGRNETW